MQILKQRLSAMNINNRVRDALATVACTGMLLASGAVGAQSFTDSVKNAKKLDTSSLSNSTKDGVNNIAAAAIVLAMLIGLFVFCWGIWWVMKASRSDGRENAGPGWMMIIGGAAFGAVGGLFALMTGIFSGITG